MRLIAKSCRVPIFSVTSKIAKIQFEEIIWYLSLSSLLDRYLKIYHLDRKPARDREVGVLGCGGDCCYFPHRARSAFRESGGAVLETSVWYIQGKGRSRLNVPKPPMAKAGRIYPPAIAVLILQN